MMRFCEDCGSPVGRDRMSECNARTLRGYDLTSFNDLRDCLGIHAGEGNRHSSGQCSPRRVAEGVLEIISTIDIMSADQRQRLRDALERLRL